MLKRREFIGTSLFLALPFGGFMKESAAAVQVPDPIVKDGDNFYESSAVDAKRVTFKNCIGMELVGNLYVPKNLAAGTGYPAIVISHPFAAVRQQAANLYAQKLAELGFVTLSFDQSFWGESAGEPRGTVLPDIYAENFSAGVDYVGCLPYVDRERIGVLGICAGGGFALAAAKIDPRIKAVATSSMYDMGEYFRTGIAGNRDGKLRAEDLAKAAQVRWKTIDSGNPVYGPGQNDPVFPEAKESDDFYRTKRGFYEPNDRRSTPASYAKFMNFYPLENLEAISPRPILIVVGEEAPSKCYSQTAFERASEPKELHVVKGANRTDLYDRVALIPWMRFDAFFKKNL